MGKGGLREGKKVMGKGRKREGEERLRGERREVKGRVKGR